MTKQHNKQSGFTLVELAIVMIIIGLLIGGILKGQELIANAQTTATIAKIKSLDGAITTFRDKYSALPGDMEDADARLSDCGTQCSADVGDGNGRIDGVELDEVVDIDNEGVVAFLHLGAADLISGVENAIDGAELAAGSALPEADIGGLIWVGFHNNGDLTDAGILAARRGHYMVIKDQIADGNTPAVADDSTGGITAVNAGRIDRKLDDGSPLSGDVRSTGDVCVNADDIYAEGDDEAFCDVVIRIQS